MKLQIDCKNINICYNNHINHNHIKRTIMSTALVSDKDYNEKYEPGLSFTNSWRSISDSEKRKRELKTKELFVLLRTMTKQRSISSDVGCEKKELDELKKTLIEKHDLNLKNDGLTAIMLALKEKLPKEVIELLLKHDRNTSLKIIDSDNGDTAIDFACETYPEDISQSHINDTKSIENKEIIKLLIRHNYDVRPNPLRPKFCSYITDVMSEMLFEGVEDNNDAAVELLLELGGNVNCVNDNKESLLMVACKKNCRLVMFQILVGFNANVNYSNKLGSVIDYVNPNFPEDIVTDSVLNDTCINRLIGWGAKESNKEKRPKFHEYVEKHKPNVLGEELIQACKRNDIMEIKRLINLGADAKYQNSYNETTISSTLYGWESAIHYKIVKHLLENGANPNVPGETGKTPLCSLCSYGLSGYDEKIIKLLLDNKAEICKETDSLFDIICPNYPDDISDGPDKDNIRNDILKKKISNAENLVLSLSGYKINLPDKEKRPNWHNFVSKLRTPKEKDDKI